MMSVFPLLYISKCAHSRFSFNKLLGVTPQTPTQNGVTIFETHCSIVSSRPRDLHTSTNPPPTHTHRQVAYQSVLTTEK